jgi:hypothetical protein
MDLAMEAFVWRERSMRNQRVTISRRSALVAGAASATALTVFPQKMTAQRAPVIQSGGGIAGGGAVSLSDGGTASFSVFGSRFEVVDQEDPTIFGGLYITDASGKQLNSVEVTDYAPVEGEENARQMTGFASIDGEGRFPFTLKLIDGGVPGEGKDQFQLAVQASSSDATPTPDDWMMNIDSVIDPGDLQLITFEFTA